MCSETKLLLLLLLLLLDILRDGSSKGSSISRDGSSKRFCLGTGGDPLDLYCLTMLNLFCANGWELCFTEEELFVLIESSYSVEFALRFGKAWNRSFVGRDLCNTFVLIRDSCSDPV